MAAGGLRGAPGRAPPRSRNLRGQEGRTLPSRAATAHPLPIRQAPRAGFRTTRYKIPLDGQQSAGMNPVACRLSAGAAQNLRLRLFESRAQRNDGVFRAAPRDCKKTVFLLACRYRDRIGAEGGQPGLSPHEESFCQALRPAQQWTLARRRERQDVARGSLALRPPDGTAMRVPSPPRSAILGDGEAALDDNTLLAHLPEPAEQQWLLDRLAELLGKRGSEIFLSAPLLKPLSLRSLDKIAPHAGGVVGMAACLLSYAGLHGFQVEVWGAFISRAQSAVPSGDQRSGGFLAHSPVSFWRIQSETCHLLLNSDSLTDGAALVASLCNALAEAYRSRHGLRLQAPQDKHRLASLTAVYLGLGILVLRGSVRRPANGLTSHGPPEPMGITLTSRALAYLLAVQVICRGLNRAARRRIARLLKPSQARCFLDSCAALAKEAAQLRARLGLPQRDGWHDEALLAELPIPDLPERIAPPPTEMEEARNPAYAPVAPVFLVRLPRRRDGLLSLLGTLAGLLLLKERAYWIALVLLTPSLLLAMQTVRRRSSPAGVCSNPECGVLLRADARTCPGCGGRVQGIIDRASERLAAQAALDGEDEEDALGVVLSRPSHRGRSESQPEPPPR